MPGIGKEIPAVYVFTVLVLLTGIVAWLYDLVIFPFTKPVLKYTVTEVNYLGAELVEVRMKPQGKKLVYEPGQFAFFSFQGYHAGEEHPFFICGEPGDDVLRIAFDERGEFSTSLYDDVVVGTEVSVNGPYGQFVQSRCKSKNQLWIAESSGILPFLAMSKNLKDCKVKLVWTLNEISRAVCTSELQEVAGKNSNFEFELWSVAENGALNIDELNNSDELNVRINSDYILMACCSIRTRKTLVSQLLKKKTLPNHILYERFMFK